MLSHLVAEHLDLTVAAVEGLLVVVAVVGVDLDVQWQAFHALLIGEVRRETLRGDADLKAATAETETSEPCLAAF